MGRLLYWIAYVPTSLYLRGKPRARVFLVCQNEVLLTQDVVGNGSWNLPGGGLHTNELPAEAAARELAEETGVTMPVAKLSFLVSSRYTKHGRCEYTVFLGSMNEKPVLKPRTSEILLCRWHTLDSLKTADRLGEDVQAAYAAFMKLS